MEQGSPMRGRVAALALSRMGNHMFIAAAAKTYACRTDREFVGLVYHYGKHKGTYPEEMLNGVMRRVPYLQQEDFNEFFHQPFERHYYDGIPDYSKPDVLLNGYFQCNRHIDRDIAFELFSPRRKTLKEIRRLYGDLSDRVCVNVRRGDYLHFCKHGFRMLSKEDIDNILREHFPGWPCLFVSDDVEWCKENFKGPQYMFADKPCSYKPEVDLYIQTVCKANVISNSSFSWWGAYLNEHTEKVVCPWPWFDEKKKGPTPGLLPDGWVKFNTCP